MKYRLLFLTAIIAATSAYGADDQEPTKAELWDELTRITEIGVLTGFPADEWLEENENLQTIAEWGRGLGDEAIFNAARQLQSEFTAGENNRRKLWYGLGLGTKVDLFYRILNENAGGSDAQPFRDILRKHGKSWLGY